jgi:hypothetical protein
VIGFVALASSGGVAGCSGGDGDAAPEKPDAETTMSTTAPIDQAEPADPTEPGSTSTAPPTTGPEGTVEVPIDPELVDALPRLEAGEGLISEDPTFDERFCTGEEAPARPKGQARATYEVSPTETITIAGYHFSAEAGPIYLADYAEAVRACAVEEVGEVEGLGLPDAIGQAFGLTTTRGSAFIAMGLRGDVIWILFQERTDGPVAVLESTYATYLSLLGG